MELKGIYIVDNNSDVHLIEIQFDDTPGNIDVGQITQELEGQPRGNWQSPWDEKYLDDKGEEIIGDYFDIPKDGFSKPLLTQDGQLNLTKPTSLPTRLRDKVKYERPD
jgi:hypothetical protein